MENASNEKPVQIPGASEGRKSTPYQRIVIACPENHIIVVKRFSNGGRNILTLSVKDAMTPHSMVRLFLLQKLKSKEDDWSLLKTRKAARWEVCLCSSVVCLGINKIESKQSGQSMHKLFKQMNSFGDSSQSFLELMCSFLMRWNLETRRNRDERNRVDEITAFARKYDDRVISRRWYAWRRLSDRNAWTSQSQDK